jgi:hypothetical protein
MAWMLLSIVAVFLLLIFGVVVLMAWGPAPTGHAPLFFHCPACRHKLSDSADNCPQCGCLFEA